MLEFDDQPRSTLEFDQPTQPAATSTEPVDNRDVAAREVLADTPWTTRQVIAAGGALSKGIEGLKGLFGGEVDPDVAKYADIAAQEAPVGAIAGEMIKYAPLLPATTVRAAMLGGTALGAAYDPTGHRMESGMLEGVLGGAGAAIGKALPVIAGKGMEYAGKAREALGGAPAQRYYGSLDRAREVLQRIVGEGNLPQASAALGRAGDVRSAQALANLPGAEQVAVLDELMRSGQGIRAAEDPIEAARFYAAQRARQEAARQATMEGLAGGGSSQDAAFARDFFMKQAEAELGPRRVAILNDLAQPGRDLREILPQLSEVERRYVSAIQNQGRMATEAAQQQVLAVGQRAADNQLIRNLPEGNFPTDPALVQPTGLPAGAYPVPGYPRVPSRYTPNEAVVGQFQQGAREAGDIAQGLRAEADALRARISELPSTFTTAPVIESIEKQLGTNVTKMNNEKVAVLQAVLDKLKTAGSDPVAVAELRKLGVNQLIGDLVQSGKLSKNIAASELNSIKKQIDAQLGPKFVTEYLEPYSKKFAEREAMALSDELRQMQRYQPEAFMKAIRGEMPDLVEKYATGGKTIQEVLGDTRYSEMSKVAGEMSRDVRLAEMGKTKEAEAAVLSLLEDKSIVRNLPNLLNRYVVLANTAIKSGEMKINKGMYRELEKAIRDPQAMKRLLDMLPPTQRSQMLGMIEKLGRGGAVAGAVSGEMVR